VPKEVGKVGTNSPTYIEPVSERKDGIASFFKKQEEKSQSGPSTSKAKPPAPPVKSEPVHSPVKVKKEDKKVVAGLGDDSNAPQPQEMVKEEPGKGKRKAAASEKADEDLPQQRSSKRLRTLNLAKPPAATKEDSDEDIEILDEKQYKGQAKAKSHGAKSEAKAEVRLHRSCGDKLQLTRCPILTIG